MYWKYVTLFLIFYSHLSFAQLPAIPFDPERYVCYKANKEVNIDGILTGEDWDKVP